MRDSKKRTVLDASGNSYEFRLRRLRCPKCGVTHTELPDFMAKNKHYSREAIESVLNGTCKDYAADDSTIRRWRK